MKTIELVFILFQWYVMFTCRLTYLLTSNQMVPDVQRGQLQFYVYQTGLLYAILKECRTIAESCRADRAMMADIHNRLEESFALTQEQKVCIRFHLYSIITDFSS
jgi:hypothetical protein